MYNAKCQPSSGSRKVAHLTGRFIYCFPSKYLRKKRRGADKPLAVAKSLCYCIRVYQLFQLLSTHDLTIVFPSLQIPNPLFDLAGITCGHCLVPFWTFFGATLIGKAIIKMHIQVRKDIEPGFLMIVTVGDASPRQARGHFGDGCIKWKHFLNDVADQARTIRGHIERVEMSLKPGFHMIVTVIVSVCRRLIGEPSPTCRNVSPTFTIIWKPGFTLIVSDRLLK